MKNSMLMSKLNNLNPVLNSGKPTIPSGKQPQVERKFLDPSSCCPQGERYPIPTFEYRVSAGGH